MHSSLLRALAAAGSTVLLLTGGTACSASSVSPPAGPTTPTTPTSTQAIAPQEAPSTDTTPTPEPTATILTPSDQGTVGHTSLVKGTVTGLPKGQLLWAVVQPLNGPNYHPQANAFAPDSAGRWSVTCYFGEEKPDSSQAFNLLIVAVDGSANAAMKAYLDQATRTKQYEGMGALPPGSTTLTSISVTRP